MSKLQKSVLVPTIIVSTLGWAWFISKAIESNDIELEKIDQVQVKIEDYSLSSQYGKSFKIVMDEYERLKEEERKRLAELERQRLEKLEKIRLAKIEEAKKLDEQKRLEEKKRQQSVSRGNTDVASGWRNAELTHYSAYCKEGCNGISASGVHIGASEYYKGYRVVASYRGIPLYTLLEVEYPNGEKFKAVVLDRGGAINHAGILDILVSSDSKGNKLGRQNGRYRIIGSLNN